MSVELRKFLKRVIVFAVPFLLYGTAIIVVDPYNYFSLSSPVGNDLKKEVSFKINYAMWKMLEYRRDPSRNILLGDSRMMSMSTDRIQEITGDEYYNFSYGGGSLKEALATFRYAESLGKIDNVYLGLDLNSYNASDTKDRVSEVLAAEKNPLLYITNTNTLISATRLVRAILTGRSDKIGKPQGDKTEFWKKQLEVTARVYYANYREPLAYRKGLAELSDHCRKQGINLVFIIFPSHMDLQNKITQYDLDAANESFKSDLARFGLVYDFAWDNEMTRDPDMFKDPYHFNNLVQDDIIRTVWGGEEHNVRVFGEATVSGTLVGEIPGNGVDSGQGAR